MANAGRPGSFPESVLPRSGGLDRSRNAWHVDSMSTVEPLPQEIVVTETDGCLRYEFPQRVTHPQILKDASNLRWSGVRVVVVSVTLIVASGQVVPLNPLGLIGLFLAVIGVALFAFALGWR